MAIKMLGHIYRRATNGWKEPLGPQGSQEELRSSTCHGWLCGLSKYQRVFLNSSVLPEQKGALRERGTMVKIMGEEHSMFSFSWKHKLPTHQFSYLRLTKICSWSSSLRSALISPFKPPESMHWDIVQCLVLCPTLMHTVFCLQESWEPVAMWMNKHCLPVAWRVSTEPSQNSGA